MWSKSTARDGTSPERGTSQSASSMPLQRRVTSGTRSPLPGQQLWNGRDKARPRSLSPNSPKNPPSPTAMKASLPPSSPLSPSATDRVFPVRSVVSVDPNPTPGGGPSPGGGEWLGDHTSTPVSVPERPSVKRSRHHSNASLPTIEQQPDARTTEPAAHPVPVGGVRANRAIEEEEENEAGIWEPEPEQDRFFQSHPNTPPRRDLGRTGTQSVSSNSLPPAFSDTASVGSHKLSISTGGISHIGLPSPTTVEPNGALMTARFKHVVTTEGHAVITGRDGDVLQRCEDEPIHIPGAVQGFGLLIALREVEDGKLQVRVVSENSQRTMGYTPKQLFDLESFTDILSEEQADNLLDHVDFIRDEEADPATNGPEVFTIAVQSPSRRVRKTWCAMHINHANEDLIICEFELEEDNMNPLVPVGEATPEPAENTLDGEPTPEEYQESTVNISKPLRVLRGARKRKGEAAAMEVFNIMSQVQEQLASAPSLEVFLKILVGVVKELTGFHRVMVYQFDSSWNGRVVTELVDPRATKDLYKGLNFPASDIPKQARDLYKINKVRLLYDRDQETARLVCRTLEDLEQPVDLTFAYLRAMSPIHIKYLANMAVRASMSISINAFNELWGLISCHGYGSKGMRVSFPIRKMCRLIGDSASRNIERLSYASRLHARKLINTLPSQGNPSGYIIASSEDLLDLFDADCGLLSIRDETKILGKLDNTQEALAMLEYLRMRKIASVTNSTDIRLEFPDLRYAPGFAFIAGLLLVPLSVGGGDFIVFFRRGQTREVKWAGNPYEKFIKAGTEGYLEPRKSFKTWSETVVGKCKEWTEEQVETAAVLCLVYGKFIEVWRQKEAALKNTQLTKLLLANSAHEVRTPLNAIINYLEIALEGSIDQETRDNLARSHSASKSLIYVINDLLDLTNTEEGRDLIKDEIFDLPATVQDATDAFIGDAKRKGIKYETIEHPGVPRHVVGDQRRVRQAISNLTANAIQHTSAGYVNVGIWLANQTENRADIDFIVQDTGVGMSSEKLDALFRELEQVQTEDDAGLQEKLSNSSQAVEGGEGPNRTLGLGLALVARIVRNMDGQLRLKSEEGKGSRFVIQLGFDLPEDSDKQSTLGDATPKAEENTTEPLAISVRQDPITPPVEVGELMLVNKSAQKTQPSEPQITHRKSMDSVQSMHSFKSARSHASSTKSEADRLIEAISQPTMAPASASEGETDIFRSNSVKSPRRSTPSSATSPSRRPSLRQHGAYSAEDVHGAVPIAGAKTPLKPIRMPDEFESDSQGLRDEVPPLEQHGPRSPSKVTFASPRRATIVPSTLLQAETERLQSGSQSNDSQQQHTIPLSSAQPTAENLQVLVAEDDPINSKIIKKRLEKLGHEVHLTINGEECAALYGEQPAKFDVVLMDMQMPIVDGLTSTKMIRSLTKTQHATNPAISKPQALDEGSDQTNTASATNVTFLSQRARLNGQTPIFAVSASLLEKERQTYIDAGFDGWILKPIDFTRLSVLLKGIVDIDVKKDCAYRPGCWEQGGWFRRSYRNTSTGSNTGDASAGEVKCPSVESGAR